MWKGPYGNWGSRKYLIASLDQSLKRLGLDYVDIFYHHRMDPETPLEETMGALDSIVKSGKALYVGLSNYDGPTLRKATAILSDLKCPLSLTRIVTLFWPHHENNALKDTAYELKKGIIAFSPLSQGLLTNRYLNGIPTDSRIATDGRFLKESALTPEKLAQIQALNVLAGERGQTLAEMALSWILRDDKVTSVLIGASKPEQILDNIKIIGHTDFTEEELQKIETIVQGWHWSTKWDCTKTVPFLSITLTIQRMRSLLLFFKYNLIIIKQPQFALGDIFDILLWFCISLVCF